MQTITFTCEVITPMFLAGADGQTPEIRPASIKGAMRFWWRAMNGDLPLKELKKREGEIFGGTDKGMGRSCVIILPLKILSENETRISGTPHHTPQFCSKNCNLRPNHSHCGKGNKQFAKLYNFEMTIRFDDNVISQGEMEDLVKTTLTLGGIGKRARRGFGSILIVKINNNPNFSTIEEIKRFLSEKIEVAGKSEFAYFKKVEIGKSFNSATSVLEAIGLASHNNASDWLGFAKGQSRFASPILVTVIKDEKNRFYPLVTTLNTAPEQNLRWPNNQNAFIQELKPQ